MSEKSHEANTVGTKEAGKLLGIQPRTVASKCRKNEFPNARQDGDRSPWQIPLADIEDYIQKYYKK